MKNLIRSISMGCLLFALPVPVEAGTGRWEVRQLGGSQNVSMRLAAEGEGRRPTLMVRCTEGKIDVSVHLDSPLSTEDNIEVWSRFDRHAAKKNYWELSADQKAILSPHSVFWSLRIELAQKLSMQLTLSEANTLDVLFDLTGSAEAMRPLRESCGFNAKVEDGWTTLHWAAAHNDLETADFLLKQGADANAMDKYGSTALHQAARENALETAGFLLKQGADANAKTKDGWTTLHWAATQNDLEIADLLLRHGADVNAKDKYGATALHQAVRENALETAGFLLKQGADADAKTKDGATALHWAATQNDLEMAGLLLAHGADANAKDKHGATALYWAAQKGHTEMADLLRRHGGKE